jgi:hypothetical protein
MVNTWQTQGKQRTGIHYPIVFEFTKIVFVMTRSRQEVIDFSKAHVVCFFHYLNRSLTMNQLNRTSKLAAVAASLALIYGGAALAQATPPATSQSAPAAQTESAPPRAEAAPPSAPAGADIGGYLNTEAIKEVCKERFPKSADKIEATWKKVSADVPPATKAQVSGPDYKTALAAKVKEVKAADPSQLKASCESMAK